MRQRGLALVGEEDEEVLAFNDLVSAWAGFFERKMGHERLRRCSSFAHLSDKCLRLQQELIAQVFFWWVFFLQTEIASVFPAKNQMQDAKTEADYQDVFETCLRTLHQHDPTVAITLGFNALLTQHIPSIIAQYGNTTVLYRGLKYTFSITDVCTMNANATVSNCFDYFRTKTVPVTAKLTLDVVPLLASTTTEPTILSTVRTVIVHLPFPTGRSVLYTPAFDDRDVRDQFLPSGALVCHGKLRSLPFIKTMRNNIMILLNKREFWKLQCRSAHHGKKFRSTSSIDFVVLKQLKKMLSISCNLPFSKSQIHVGILALAFGCPPTEFISLLKAMMGSKYDSTVFRSYEISLMYDPSVLAVHTQEEATLVISRMFGKEILSTGVSQLRTEVFPHINIQYEDGDINDLYKAKLLYLARCVCLIILFAAGKIEDTPRDFFTYSSITTPADSIGTLFRLLFITHIKTRSKLMRRLLMRMLQKEPETQTHIDLVKLYGESHLTTRMLSAVASGSFSATKKGVTIPLNTNNTEGVIGQLLRISSSLSTTDSTHTDARHVQFDGYRNACPSKSPDGESVGLVISHAQYSTVTSDCIHPFRLTQVLEVLLNHNEQLLIPINDIIGKDLDAAMLQSKVYGETSKHQEDAVFQGPATNFTNWKPTFFTYFNNCGNQTHFIEEENVERVINKFRSLRRKGMFTPFAFLQKFEKRRELHVICEGGQLISPLVVVENLHLAKRGMGFREMMSLGIVEYVNPAEEATIIHGKVATSFIFYKQCLEAKREITHIELNQTTFCCREVACIPFVTSQAAPRASFLSQQDKQVMTADALKPNGAVLTTQLWHTSRPLTLTLAASQTPSIQSSSGRGYSTQIAFLSRDNQEDMFEINKASVQRGWLAASTTRVYTSDAALPTKMYREQFERCDDVISRKNLDYSNIQENGVNKQGTYIPGGSIVISKTRIEKTNVRCPSFGSTNSSSKPSSTISTRKMCISTTSRPDERGIVARNIHVTTPVGDRMVSEVRTTRFVSLADKFSDKHSQKGVAGALVEQKNMIFSLQTGVSPDMISNELSIISRLTLSSELECITGKSVAITGDMKHGVDHQRFEETNADKVAANMRILKAYGFSPKGTEAFIDGNTGKILLGQVFVGIADVSRLVHLADKKMHARDGGKRERLTRQPCEGRRLGGGLRVGPMEAAALGAHGAAAIVQTAFKQQSDPFDIPICSRCNMAAHGNEGLNYAWCPSCQSRDCIVIVNISFTWLVTSTELMAMGLCVYFHAEVEKKGRRQKSKEQVFFPKAIC